MTIDLNGVNFRFIVITILLVAVISCAGGDGGITGTGNNEKTIKGTANKGPFKKPAEDDGEYFTGRIDEVRIYDRALAPSEIKALYEARNEP